MGRPTYFAGIGRRAPSPVDARPLPFRGAPDRDAGLQQWQRLAELLAERGFEIFAIPADKKLPELAFAGGAGLLLDRSAERRVEEKIFIVASSGETEQDAIQSAFDRALRGIGFKTEALAYRFAGAADFMRCGDKWLFTPGMDLDKSQTSVGTIKLPSFFGGSKRGDWGTEPSAREKLIDLVRGYDVIDMPIVDPRFPRGDLVCHPIGPKRQMLMVYVNAFHPDAQAVLLGRKAKVSDYIIPLSESDAAMYAANGFQFSDTSGKTTMVLPEGVSNELLGRLEAVGVTPLLVDVSAWIRKDRGGIRSMICDLGWVLTDARTEPSVVEYRRSIKFVAPEPTPQGSAAPAGST